MYAEQKIRWFIYGAIFASAIVFAYKVFDSLTTDGWYL